MRNTSGTVLSVLDLRNDAWLEGVWMEIQNIDLLPWAGQTVRLAFRATNDSSLVTSFYVDDVAVTTCPTGGGGNTPPVVDITAPASGSSFPFGTSVTFTGTATDAEDGNLTAGLAWTSSINGAIGSGGSFSTSALSIGTHTITASVTDSGSLPGSDAITVTITGDLTVTFTSIGAEDGRVIESSENTNVGGTATPNSTASSALRVGDNNQDRQFKSFVSFDTCVDPGRRDHRLGDACSCGAARSPAPTRSPPTAPAGWTSQTGAFGGTNALAAGRLPGRGHGGQRRQPVEPDGERRAVDGDASTPRAARRSTRPARTQLRVYFTLDDNDDTGNDYIGFSGGEATTANRPVLVVTYQP